MGEDVKQYSVFRLAWPIFLQMLLSMCLGYADTIMMSHYSDTAVGALGNANQIMGFLTLAFSIISSATGVVVSQYLGAGQDSDRMNRIYSVAVAFNLVLSVVICFTVTIFSRQLLRLMHVPDVMMADANRYMKIVGCFLFTDAVVSVFSQIFNCNGKTFLGMFIFFGMNVVNIGGNYLFLYGPLSYLKSGVTGVAAATSVSSILGMAAAVVCFKFFIKGKLSFRYFKPFPKDVLAKLIRLGIPTAGENISYQISQICITIFVNLLGPVAITTKIYCNILCNFSMIYSNSVAGATAIITGHSVGAGDYDYAYRRVLKGLGGAFVISMIIAAANWLLSPFTLHLFTNDLSIIALGRKIMFVGMCLELGRTTNLVIIQSMRAAGDVVFPTVLGICSMWGISVVFAYVLGIGCGFGLPGVWAGMAADEIFRAVVVFIRWHKGSWRNKSVVEKSED